MFTFRVYVLDQVLDQVLDRYGGKKLERLRHLFEQASKEVRIIISQGLLPVVARMCFPCLSNSVLLTDLCYTCWF